MDDSKEVEDALSRASQATHGGARAREAARLCHLALKPRFRVTIVTKGFHLLSRFVDEGSTRKDALRTIALCARTPETHASLFQQGVLDVLLRFLNKRYSRGVLEAVTAGLTSLATESPMRTRIAVSSLRQMAGLLDLQKTDSVRTNTLALLSALVKDADVKEQVVRMGFVPKLFKLKRSSQPDVRTNAQATLLTLGFDKKEPTQMYISCVEQLSELGLGKRGDIDWGLLQAKSRDVNRVSGWLLDNPAPDDFEYLPVPADAVDAHHADKDLDSPAKHGAGASSRSPANAKQKDAKSSMEPEEMRGHLLLMGFSPQNIESAMKVTKDLMVAIDLLTRDESKSGSARSSNSKSASIDSAPKGRPADQPAWGKHAPPVRSPSHGTLHPHPASSRGAGRVPLPAGSSAAFVTADSSHFRSLSTDPVRSASRDSNDIDIDLTALVVDTELEDDAKDAKQHAQPPPSPAVGGRDRVKNWLRQNGWQKYIAKFEQHEVNMDALPLLSQQDLEKIGVTAIGVSTLMLNKARQLAGSGSSGHAGGVAPGGNDVPPPNGGSPNPGGSPGPSSGGSGYNSSSNGTPVPGPVSAPLSNDPLLDFAMLQATALVDERPGVRHLDMEAERNEISQVLQEGNRAIKVLYEVATTDMMLNAISKGVRVLHISGHGHPDRLMLEDGKGGKVPLQTDRLRQVIRHLKVRHLQFVLLSACASKKVAAAFVNARVPHVIAVGGDVSDNSAREFSKSVYRKLLQGGTVSRAFEEGCAAALTCLDHNYVPCCCSHKHRLACICPRCKIASCCKAHSNICMHRNVQCDCCDEDADHPDSKFVLLGNADHDVPIFADFAHGPPMDLTPPYPPNNLPAMTDYFVGRGHLVHWALQMLLTGRRLFTITGPPGIGKSAVARSLASFALKRRHFDGIFFIRCQDLDNVDIVRARIYDILQDHYPSIPLSPMMKDRKSSAALSATAPVDLKGVDMPEQHRSSLSADDALKAYSRRARTDIYQASSPPQSSSLEDDEKTNDADTKASATVPTVPTVPSMDPSSSSSTWTRPPQGAEPSVSSNASSDSNGSRPRFSSRCFIRDKNILLVLDHCGNFHKSSKDRTKFRRFLCSLLEDFPKFSVVVTDEKDFGRIDNVSHKILPLPLLHAHDCVALFIRRVPRMLDERDYDKRVDRPPTVEDFLQLRIFTKIQGNPLLIEECASVLQHLWLGRLTELIDMPPSQWPANLEEEVKEALVKIQLICDVELNVPIAPRRPAISHSAPAPRHLPQAQRLQQQQQSPPHLIPSPAHSMPSIPDSPVSP